MLQYFIRSSLLHKITITHSQLPTLLRCWTYMEQQPDNPTVKNAHKKSPLYLRFPSPLRFGLARWLYSNRQREGKKNASWRAAAKGRRASLCSEDERAHGKASQWAGGGDKEEEAARGSSCWQALNVQLLHISPPPQSASLWALCGRDRKPLRTRDEAEGWQVASTWSPGP